MNFRASKNIIEYYDLLSADYDASRFAGSYGRYVHGQETAILKKKIQPGLKTLDMACGTGRFLGFAEYGIDLSEKMLEIAGSKYPGKNLEQKDAENTGFDDCFFERIISFHLFMHLNREKSEQIFEESCRILKPGGRLIFDVPSKKRRLVTRSTRSGWHGNNDMTVSEIQSMLGRSLKIISVTGVLFFPVHRIPERLRSLLHGLDNMLCRSLIKEYASYLVIEAEKR
jgi:ubiquinone/menaquinone biosynthesis C-methylase UbiE